MTVNYVDPVWEGAHRRRDYMYAVVLWVVIVAISVVLSIAFPPLRVSILSLALTPFGGDYDQPSGTILDGWPVYIFGLLMILLLAKTKRIYQAARREEDKYRRGCENWSWRRRIGSCALFGAAHFWNIVIPLSVVIGLSVAGAYLMAVYLRRYRETGSAEWATAAATHAHVAYNRVALGFFAAVFAALTVAALVTAP